MRSSYSAVAALLLSCFVLALTPADLYAQVTTTGLEYNFDANADQTLDDGWESSVNSGIRDWEFTLDTRVGTGNDILQSNTLLGDLHGISGRLNFPRTSSGLSDSRDNGGATTYNSAPGFSTDDASWEFWIRLDNVTDNQIIWESGGSGSGSAFTISGGNLEWVIKNGAATDFVSSAITAGEYHHVVGVYERDDAAATVNSGSADTMTLYIDGVLVGTTRDNGAETAMHLWDGGDHAGLGGGGASTGFASNGAVGGSDGALGNIASYTNLDGRIAAYRFYDGALTSADVANNIAAVQAEFVYFDDGFGTPGTDTLWRNETNWDTNLVSSQNQNTVINADQTVVIDAQTTANTQTLYIGDDGVSSLSGYVSDGTTPAGGDGTLVMNGGTLNATQIILGDNGHIGTFDFIDGTINVAKNADADVSGQEAFQVGFSDSGTGTNVLTMGMLDGSTTPVLNISGGRLEIGDNGNDVGSSKVDATFNMRSGILNVNGQNMILGQSNIADDSAIRFNLSGGEVNVGSDMNFNDGSVVMTQTGGVISVRDLQTQNTGAATDVVNLNGGIFEIRDDLNDRNGTSTLNIDGGRLELDGAVVATREVENINFSSGVIEFSIADAGDGTTALTVGSGSDPNGAGVFTGTGQIDIELDNIDIGISSASTTTWGVGSGSGEWTKTNNTEWSAANPIQYILSGTQYTLIQGNNAATVMTDLGDLTSANADWVLETFNTHNTDDSLRAVAANNVALTPIKAVIDAAGQTITRNSTLIISSEVGADAAELDLIDGTLDLGTSGSDLRIGGEGEGNLSQSGGILTVNNIIFGGGEDTTGGTIELTGGVLTVDGSIVEGALGAPTSTVDTAQLLLSNGHELTVAGDIFVQQFNVGALSGGAATTYTATNQTVASSGTTAVGDAGTGIYTMDGSTHAASNFTIGSTATGVGTVTQRGGSIETSGEFAAGKSGDGTYTLERHGYFQSGTLTVGGEFVVGTGGTGTVNILDGVVDINGAGLDVASGVGSTGNFTLGSSAGVYNPLVNVGGGNFETANQGTGNVNLLSGQVVLETNNLITGQSAASVANVIMGGGQGKFVMNSLVSNDWNTNDGQGNVDVLKNATINLGRNLNLGTGGALDLDLIGGAINIGVNNGGGDLDYRGGTGTTDIIKVTDALLTIADDFIFDDGTGVFQVNGSGSKITVGDAYTQAAGNELIAAFDPLGVTAIEVGGDVTLAGSLNIDETRIGTVAPNSASTLGVAGAWDATPTNWDEGNPSAVGILTGDRVVVIEYGGVLTDNGYALDAGDAANWTLDTGTAGEVAVIAQTDFGSAPVNAILDSDGTTTRASNLTIDASGAAADAAGLTVTSGDTLALGGNTLTVQGGATLAGEGTVSGGNTTITSGAFLSSGATETGLVGGGSTAGTMTFSGDLTMDSGSTWLVDIVDSTTADKIDVSGALTIGGANLEFGGFAPDTETTYAVASYGSLSGTFSGLAEGAMINGYEINYGTRAGYSNQITLTAVPEPLTMIPMILGALTAGFFARRRKRAKE
ncbi:MAG: PEP-CTERM sorting domain-containing protein [Verrucomicrobiales bacterium]|nr:PEP-CTERM sorting domain-containing protein [Verrucomicrobiales bacterium]